MVVVVHSGVSCLGHLHANETHGERPSYTPTAVLTAALVPTHRISQEQEQSTQETPGVERLINGILRHEQRVIEMPSSRFRD